MNAGHGGANCLRRRGNLPKLLRQKGLRPRGKLPGSWAGGAHGNFPEVGPPRINGLTSFKTGAEVVLLVSTNL